MPTKQCCCQCALGEDNFARPDSADDPGPNWEVLSGEWGIDDNVLVNRTPGVLATRICHPQTFPRGAFIAGFSLMNVGEGRTYRVRAGDPASDHYELTVVVIPGNPFGTVNVKLVAGAEEEEWTYIDWYPTDAIRIEFCHAPGIYMTAVVSFGGALAYPQQVDLIIGESGEPCYNVDQKEVGNFSFIEGDFDDWVYSAHWIDRRACPLCSCFCYSNGQDETILPMPKTLTLNITDKDGCPALAGSYEMVQGELGPSSDPFAVYPRPDKMYWASTPIIMCEGVDGWVDDGHIWFQLECFGVDTLNGRPRFELSLTKERVVYENQELRFDPEDPDTTTPGPMFGPQSHARAKAGSTCDPLMLIFPDLVNKVSLANPGSNCCLGPILDVDPGSEDFSSRAGVYITL